jgi:Na+/melibiose symporter-like transporter
LTLVAAWAWRWIDGHPAVARRYEPEGGRRAARIVATLLVIGATGALLNGLRGRPEGVAASLGYAAVGGMVSLVVALVAFGILEKPRTTETS